MTGLFDQINNKFNQINDLDKFALEFGSDKGTQGVNNLSAKCYTKVYYEYFENIRDYELNILEIGIFDGASLLCRHFIQNMGIIVYDPCPVRVL
jgi:hypothetical protein